MANLFPKHNISPAKKGKEWILQCAKAIWDDREVSTSNMFAKGKVDYDLIAKYVLGDQPTDKYKLLLLGSEFCNDEKSLAAIDWRVRPIAAKLREIAISKILEREYNYRCTPIDGMAKNEAEDYYTKVKMKIMQRDAALAVNPELAQNPAFIKEQGEPGDLEELEMEMDYGPARKMATESELTVQLIMYKNMYESIRKTNASNFVDYGVAGVIEDVDENGNIFLEEAQLDTVVMSHCRKEDFSDMTHWGVIKEVRLSQLASKFTDIEMEVIKQTAVENKEYSYGNSEFNDDFDPFKVKVLQFKIFSWDSQVFQQRVDRRGNLVVREEEYSDSLRDNTNTVEFEGKKLRQYKTKTKEVIYEGKWIVGTDFIYDYGRAKYEKRSKPNRALTQMGCHFNAYTFKDMQASSLMNRLIPIIDEYQMTVYHIQNFKNKWVPYVMDIDFTALEKVSLGGRPMSPKALLQMVYRNFTLVSRRSQESQMNPNYKAIDIRPTGMAHEYEVLVADLVRLYNEMRDIVGLNEITDASTPNSNLLNGVASMGAQGTNNALRQVMVSERTLGESVARGVIQRAVQVIKDHKIEGLLPAMGSESMRFIQVSPDIALHDWGIMVEDRPTNEERQALIQELNLKDASGQINPKYSLIIKETQNLKQARAKLAYYLDKEKKETRQHELQVMQTNGKVQQESTVTAEKAKQETIRLEQSLITQREIELKKMEMEMLKLKLQAAQQVKDTDVAGKISTQVVANEGKAEAAAAKPEKSGEK